MNLSTAFRLSRQARCDGRPGCRTRGGHRLARRVSSGARSQELRAHFLTWIVLNSSAVSGLTMSPSTLELVTSAGGEWVSAKAGR